MIKPEEVRDGLKVYWNDPDQGLCSGPGTIALDEEFKDHEFDEETILSVYKDDGGEVECTIGELDLA